MKTCPRSEVIGSIREKDKERYIFTNKCILWIWMFQIIALSTAYSLDLWICHFCHCLISFLCLIRDRVGEGEIPFLEDKPIPREASVLITWKGSAFNMHGYLSILVTWKLARNLQPVILVKYWLHIGCGGLKGNFGNYTKFENDLK